MDRHRPVSTKLTKEIAGGLASYTSAPPVTRCCALIVATRSEAPEIEQLGSVFLGADADADGKLSHEDLADALDSAEGWWWERPADNLDVAELLDAANLDHSGRLGYTEFVAACLCGRQSTEELITEAFHALDDDRDGWVRMQDIHMLFQERDMPFLRSLPQDRAFNLKQWKTCAKSCNGRSAKPSTESKGLLNHFLGRLQVVV